MTGTEHYNGTSNPTQHRHTRPRSTTSPAAAPPPPSSTDDGCTTPSDGLTEFLARKHAELQTLLARFPIIPRLIAIGMAYCAVFCICVASLVVLFVGSFVLTGHDRVVARLRWLLELARARRDEGLAGRGLSLVWWLIRLAGDLVTAMVGTATPAAPNGRGGGRSEERATS